MILKERVSLQKKLEYIASKGIFYDIWLWEAWLEEPYKAYILIQRVWPNPKKAYVSKSIARVFGQLYNDIKIWNKCNCWENQACNNCN
jgi:hypothetical protein